MSNYIKVTTLQEQKEIAAAAKKVGGYSQLVKLAAEYEKKKKQKAT